MNDWFSWYSKQLQYFSLLTCHAKSGGSPTIILKVARSTLQTSFWEWPWLSYPMLGFCSLACEDPEYGDILFFFWFRRLHKLENRMVIRYSMVYGILYLYHPISTSRKHFLWKLWFPLVNSSLVCEHRLDFWDFVFTPKSSHQTGRSLMSWRKTIDCRQTTTGNSQTIKQLKNQRPFVCFDLPNLKVKKILDDFAKPCMVHLLFHLVCRISFHASSFRSLGFDDFAWFTWGILGEDCSITPSAAPAQAKLSHPNLL